ncbi:MAG: protoporphyrinogen oxidase [Verrucomicrobiota bacterium]
MATSASKHIAILGAGITGLTAAYRLLQRGHTVRLFEATDRVGGAIGTEISGDWLIEKGPNSLLAGDPALDALIAEVGLTAERVTANPLARNRYLVRRGQPVAAPLSPPAFLRSPLFSLGAKFRLATEFLVRPRVRHADLSLEDFIRVHFGQEIVDYALNPFVTGVYAGNPKKLSARYAFPKLWEIEQKHGSLLRGQIAAAKARTPEQRAAAGIISFRRGLQALPDALARRLAPGVLSLTARIEALIPAERARWSVVWHNNASSATTTETFDAVIAALPAPALAQLRVGTLGERPLASLDAIEHPPVSSLFLGYRRADVAHALDGFGMLVPEVEKRSILGVLFTSTLFPGRAPADHVALTVLVGGTRQPELGRLPTTELLKVVQPDLAALLGVRGAPVFHRHTFWSRAIPQYNLGYESHLDTMTAAERAHRGLLIGGQARDGISMPACVAAGEKLAARVGQAE